MTPLPPFATKMVRYDLSAAEVEGAVRSRLIELGWIPPHVEALPALLPPEELHTLLENAAKACGYKYHAGSGTIINAQLNVQEWQPHLPGLDSQLLAAELGIDTQWDDSCGKVMCAVLLECIQTERYADHPSKAHAQTMAVLRVAAKIGSLK